MSQATEDPASQHNLWQDVEFVDRSFLLPLHAAPRPDLCITSRIQLLTVEKFDVVVPLMARKRGAHCPVTSDPCWGRCVYLQLQFLMAGVAKRNVGLVPNLAGSAATTFHWKTTLQHSRL